MSSGTVAAMGVAASSTAGDAGAADVSIALQRDRQALARASSANSGRMPSSIAARGNGG